MARKKSPIGSILSATFFTAAAASVGYLAYRSLSSKNAKNPSKKTAASGKSGKKSGQKKRKSKRPRGSISRRKKPTVSQGSPSHSKKQKKAEPKVKWIPNLRVREQKILNTMSQGKEVSMPEIAKKFKDVTVRTLRRDMDSLVEKGRVTKSGTTRATTYRKV